MERRFHERQVRHHQFAQATQFAGSLVATASLVFYNSGQVKKIDGSSVGVNFDLEAASLFRHHVCTMKETQGGKAATESKNVLGKGAAEIRCMATSMEATKIAIQLPLRSADAGVIPDDQGSIHCHDRVAAAGLGLYPVQDFIRMFQASDSLKVQSAVRKADRG